LKRWSGFEAGVGCTPRGINPGYGYVCKQRSVMCGLTDSCSVDCARERNLKRLRRSLRRLRSAINNNRETFAIQYVNFTRRYCLRQRSYVLYGVCLSHFVRLLATSNVKNSDRIITRILPLSLDKEEIQWHRQLWGTGARAPVDFQQLHV